MNINCSTPDCNEMATHFFRVTRGIKFITAACDFCTKRMRDEPSDATIQIIDLLTFVTEEIMEELEIQPYFINSWRILNPRIDKVFRF